LEIAKSRSAGPELFVGPWSSTNLSLYYSMVGPHEFPDHSRIRTEISECERHVTLLSHVLFSCPIEKSIQSGKKCKSDVENQGLLFR